MKDYDFLDTEYPHIPIDWIYDGDDLTVLED